MAFSPPEYCRLFAQKKAYQGGVTGTPGPPLATSLGCKTSGRKNPGCETSRCKTPGRKTSGCKTPVVRPLDVRPLDVGSQVVRPRSGCETPECKTPRS